MGKIRKFTIELNNATGAYYAGQSVSGKVVLELTETIKLKGEPVFSIFDSQNRKNFIFFSIKILLQH
jgi:hypothetical protein